MAPSLQNSEGGFADARSGAGDHGYFVLLVHCCLVVLLVYVLLVYLFICLLVYGSYRKKDWIWAPALFVRHESRQRRHEPRLSAVVGRLTNNPHFFVHYYDENTPNHTAALFCSATIFPHKPTTSLLPSATGLSTRPPVLVQPARRQMGSGPVGNGASAPWYSARTGRAHSTERRNLLERWPLFHRGEGGYKSTSRDTEAGIRTSTLKAHNPSAVTLVTPEQQKYQCLGNLHPSSKPGQYYRLQTLVSILKPASPVLAILPMASATQEKCLLRRPTRLSVRIRSSQPHGISFIANLRGERIKPIRTTPLIISGWIRMEPMV